MVAVCNTVNSTSLAVCALKGTQSGPKELMQLLKVGQLIYRQ